MHWDNKIIEEVRRRKERERSDDRDALLVLASDHLYADKIHYALELIQNAEDEGASSITFIFNREYTAIINDGKPFDPEDLLDICSVRPGGKSNKIGFFGVGFKSVFKITDRPQIISSNFNFVIERKIYPFPGGSIPEELTTYYHPNKGAIFVLPYNEQVSDPDELINKLHDLDENLLLFLDHIKRITFVDNINNREWEITKDTVSPDTYILLHSGKHSVEKKWKVFHRTLTIDSKEAPIPERRTKIKQTRLTIAFPYKPENASPDPATNVIYCYLPTKKRSDLPFLIQADFTPTVGRETITDEPWNDWLLKKLGDFAAYCLEQVAHSELKADLLNFIPLEEEVKDPQIQTLYACLRNSLLERKVLKTLSGDIVKPTEAAFPRKEIIGQLLTENDLNKILSGNLQYIKGSLSERSKRVLEQLEAFPIDETEIIAFIKQESAVKLKGKAWFLELFDYLASYFGKGSVFLDQEKQQLYEEFIGCKCILTNRGELVSIKDPDRPDRLICYSGISGVAELSNLFTDDELIILHPFFQTTYKSDSKKSQELNEKRERVKGFFDSLGIRKHFRQYHVIEQVILPKFRSGQYKKHSAAQLYKYIDYIRTNLGSYELEVKKHRPKAYSSKDIYSSIIDSIMLKGTVIRGGQKLEVDRKPSDLYFSQAYSKSDNMQELFEGVNDIAFLSSFYINRSKNEAKKSKKKANRKKAEPKDVLSWRKFFELLGVWNCPRYVTHVSAISISGDSSYSWIDKRYSSRGLHQVVGDSESPDLLALFKYLSAIDDPELQTKRLEALWKTLEKNWTSVYKKACSCTYRYYYYDWQQVNVATSTFLEMLRNWKWVLASDDAVSRPVGMFLNTYRNKLLIGKDGVFTKYEGSKSFLEDIGIHIEPNITEVLNHLIRLRQDNTQEKNRIEECRVIYTFLRDNQSANSDEKNKNKIGETFKTKSLIYLPRKDQSWWPQASVYWQDYSSLFGSLRGYVEQDGKEIYVNDLKDWFFSIGIKTRPTISDCLAFLDSLKPDIVSFKRYAPKLYLHIEGSCDTEGYAVAWQDYTFLSTKEEFLQPRMLYSPDNDEYMRLLGGELDTLWLPYSTTSIQHLLNSAGFESLNDNVQVDEKISGDREVDADSISRMANILKAAEAYLSSTHPSKYELLRKEGFLENSRALSIRFAEAIELSYSIEHIREARIITAHERRDVFLNSRNNYLYITPQATLFSTPVAKELSRFFRGAEMEACSFIDAMMQTEGDTDSIRSKLSFYGVDMFVPAEDEGKGFEIELLAEEPQAEIHEPTPPQITKKVAAPPNTTVSAPSLQIKVITDLVNPNEYIEDELEERVPNTRTKAGLKSTVKKQIKLKLGQHTNARPARTLHFRISPSTLSVEDVSLELAMRHEEELGHLPQDRHKQRNIGYDIYSKDKEGKERFIEVKSFRGDTGLITLYATEWAKAEQAQDNYYLFIYTGLNGQTSPTLWEIQNPAKFLTVDPPHDKRISKWQDAVVRKTKLVKI